MQFNNKQEWLHLLKEEYMCQYQYVRLFWDIFLALLEKNYKLCCWVLRGSVENSSWGQLLPISRAMSNYEGGATQAALLPHVTPATPSGCCGQQPNAVSCFLRLTWEWMGVTVLGVHSESKPSHGSQWLGSWAWLGVVMRGRARQAIWARLNHKYII